MALPPVPPPGPKRSTPALTLGSLVNGTYRLERLVAEGGMGMVYEAAHVRLPRRFAIKVLGKPGDPRVGATALARFRREAEIASALGNQHIVEVFDYQIAESGQPYLVMELLDGEDLADRLRRHGRLPLPAALRIISEVAQALDVAHTAGVVHRDLKPANIFLCRRGQRDDWVKVLDFGVSKVVDAATLTHEKAMVGTPLYMSPEQAVGTQELQRASDIFSLGSIAYEILTGKRAFSGASIPSILYQIVHGPTPRVPDLGGGRDLAPRFQEVFERVLAKQPDQRFACASDFAKALEEVLDRGQPSVIDATLDHDAPTPSPEGGFVVGMRSLAGAQDDATQAESSTNDGRENSGLKRAREALAVPPPAPTPPTPIPMLAKESLVIDDTPARTTLVIDGLPTAAFKLTRPVPWRLVVLSCALGAVSTFTWHLLVMKPDPLPPVSVVTSPALSPTRVRYEFHVHPRGAEVYVDGALVDGETIDLPLQPNPRLIRVVASGYRPQVLTASATESHTFELRLERHHR